jgi:hypothetical protein
MLPFTPVLSTSTAAPHPAVGFEWVEPSRDVGPALQCSALAAVAPHLFTAARLRLRGDAAEWEAAAAALGRDSSALRLIKQVHRADVAVVRRLDASGWHMPAADIILSENPQLVVGVRAADCAPVLLADRRRQVVAAVHAGWRGTAQSAVQKAVAALTAEFGSMPADLVAAIGPCLGVCCGEVGEEVVEAFREAGHGERVLDRWFSRGPGERWHLHLARANRDQLVEAGLRAADVHSAGLCTRSFPHALHSHRADGEKAGRMAALIRAPGPAGR